MNSDDRPAPRSLEHNVILEDLTKRFGDVLAVDRISLQVKKGEFVTLLGPSGSGKTTALMMIAGFHMPTSGRIFIEDEMVVFKPSFKRNIGMAFQNYALFPHMTVYDNIAFPLRMRKIDEKEIKKSVEKALDLVRLSGFGKRYPKQLSGGQQQRIALVRALVYNPPVLLMDEPLGALDRKLREHMQLEMKHIHQSLGITVIYVTHDQDEALTMSDRIAVVNRGRIEQIGAPSELYERPRNRFVADFIGETNLVDAEVIRQMESGIELLTSNGLQIAVPTQSPVSTKKVTLAIRPEKIMFLDRHDDSLNVFSGVIDELVYLGDGSKYRVLIDGKEPFVVAQKNDLRSSQYKVRDRVLVGWRSEDVSLV